MIATTLAARDDGRFPRGKRGLKSASDEIEGRYNASLPSREVWIEIRKSQVPTMMNLVASFAGSVD